MCFSALYLLCCFGLFLFFLCSFLSATLVFGIKYVMLWWSVRSLCVCCFFPPFLPPDLAILFLLSLPPPCHTCKIWDIRAHMSTPVSTYRVPPVLYCFTAPMQTIREHPRPSGLVLTIFVLSAQNDCACLCVRVCCVCILANLARACVCSRVYASVCVQGCNRSHCACLGLCLGRVCTCVPCVYVCMYFCQNMGIYLYGCII